MPKVLIIRFSSIGDIVLTTPVIRCLKLQLNAEVHFLTKQSYQSILSSNPYLTRIYTINKKVNEILPDLKKEKYDYIIDLHKNLRSAQVKFALSAQAFSFDKLNWEKWLLVNLNINQLPPIHIVDRYLKTVESLGVKNDGAGLDYFIPENTSLESFSLRDGNKLNVNDLKEKEQKSRGNEQLQLDEIPSNCDLPSHLDFNSNSNKTIVFAIGAAHQTKRLPTKKIMEICAAILNQKYDKNTPCSIALIGGPAEQKEGEQIAQQFQNRVISYCGKISLNQSALLIKKADVVITHDTGMMHIAAALKKKIVSIWGNTVPEFGMYPYYPITNIPNVIIEQKGLRCRPCSKIGHAQCPKGHFKCMQQMDTQQIVETVKLLTKTNFA